MIRKNRRKYAWEVLDELLADPIERKRYEQWSLEQSERRDQVRLLFQPVALELADLGIQVETPSDLFSFTPSRHSTMSSDRAIPTLLKWLPLIGDEGIKSDMVRAVTTRAARPTGAKILLSEWRNIPPGERPQLKWIIGNALSVIADKCEAAALLEIAQQREEGHARDMIIRALWRFKDPRTLHVLVDLLDDDVIAASALASLRRLKGKALVAKSKIESLVTHPDKFVRLEAQKTLDMFSKLEES